MITSIVASVRQLLSSGKSSSSEAKVSVEIVFPVSSESITQTSTKSTTGLKSVQLGDLALPGVSSGEGCSINGGIYASCPYMKSEHIDFTTESLSQTSERNNMLSSYEAGRYDSQTPLGNSLCQMLDVNRFST